jgi:uncharacterized protein (TIGR00730 family)
MASINAEPDDHNIENHFLKDETYMHHFRIAILGSARTKPEHEYYKQVFDLAKAMGQRGYDVVTGGGPGLMNAANEGHQEGRKNQNSHSIGLTIELPWEAVPNRHLDMHEHFNRFSDRLDEFLLLSNVAVFTHGGVGTCLEFFYVWQHIQVKHISPIPMIFVGSMWHGLVKWLIEHPLHLGLISSDNFDNLYVVETNEEAQEIIDAAYKTYDKEGNDYEFKYDKYRALDA